MKNNMKPRERSYIERHAEELWQGTILQAYGYAWRIKPIDEYVYSIQKQQVDGHMLKVSAWQEVGFFDVEEGRCLK